MVPEAAENGWILKAAEGTEGGNAIGYFGTTYKEGWLLAYDFTIASGNATINMSFVRGLQDSEYPGGAPDYCLSKAIAAQHGIATKRPPCRRAPIRAYWISARYLRASTALISSSISACIWVEPR